MEHISPEDGAYFQYGPDSYRAASARSVLRVEGFVRRLEPAEFPRLGDFLADEFLNCKVGQEGLWLDFDTEPHELWIPGEPDEILHFQTDLSHGLSNQG
jgi:hypothetical protein